MTRESEESERKEQVSGENSQSLVRVRIIDFTQFHLTWPADLAELTVRRIP